MRGKNISGQRRAMWTKGMTARYVWHGKIQKVKVVKVESPFVHIRLPDGSYQSTIEKELR